MTETLPGIEPCIDLYLVARDEFSTDSFASDQLSHRLTDASTTDSRRLEERLNLLVAYGLLEWDDGTYRLRNDPDEDVEHWQDRNAVRTTALYRLVEQAQQRREENHSSTTEAALLRHRGQTYASAFVDQETTLESVAAEVADLVARADDSDGVVLRSPAVRSGDVQQLADRLCDGDLPTDVGLSRRFEKEATDLIGEDKDTLEFRLFLRPVR